MFGAARKCTMIYPPSPGYLMWGFSGRPSLNNMISSSIIHEAVGRKYLVILLLLPFLIEMVQVIRHENRHGTHYRPANTSDYTKNVASGRSPITAACLQHSNSWSTRWRRRGRANLRIVQRVNI